MLAGLIEFLAVYARGEPLMLERRAGWRTRLRWREAFAPDVYTNNGKRPTGRPWESLLDPRAQALLHMDAREAYRKVAVPAQAYIFFDVGHGARREELSFCVDLADKPAHEAARLLVEGGALCLDMYVTDGAVSWTMVWPHERDYVPIFSFARDASDPPADSASD